jgi:membrane protease YdiL (CAAX protease family)
LALGGSAFCGGNESREISPWEWFVPGAAEFSRGETGKGVLFSAGTAGLLGWGIYSEVKKDSGQLNAPLIYAQQLYIIGIYDNYRSLYMDSGLARYNRRFDPAPLSTLAAAPFSRELLNPWVLGALAVGAGLNFAIAKSDVKHGGYSGVSGISYLGNSFNRDTGTAVLSAHWLVLSWGAGVSEEMLFRGIIQSQWEREWGDTAGLLSASALFGLAHIADPSSGDSWFSAGFAAAAGVYFGLRYRARNYTLSEVIAAHTWFDIAAGVSSFLADPEDNPLGAKIQFAF